MSAIARAIIGEDEELRRLAMSGLPQDRLRILRMKRAFESLGFINVSIHQRQNKHRDHDHWTVLLRPKDPSEPWHMLTNKEKDEKGFDLVRQVLEITGYHRPNPYRLIYTRAWSTGSTELIFLMPRIGKFDGYIKPDNRFVDHVVRDL